MFCCILFHLFLTVMASLGCHGHHKNSLSVLKLGNKMHRDLFLWKVRVFWENEYRWMASALSAPHWAGFKAKNFRMLW